MSEYYAVTNMMEDATMPIRCDGFIVLDSGWVQFYTGELDTIVLSIPPDYFFFRQVEQEEYEEMLAQMNAEDEEYDDEVQWDEETSGLDDWPVVPLQKED